MSESNQTLVKSLAEGLASLAIVGFVVSVVYDWGFLRALGLDFSYLPSITADHFRSGLLWFPPLLGMVFGYFAVEFLFQRLERGLTEKEIIESSSNPERLRKFREGPGKLVVWTAPIYIVMYVLIGDAYASFLPAMLGILWLGFADWCYSTPLIKQRRSKSLQRGFTLLPMFAIVAFFNGYNTAVDAAWRKPIEVTIERQDPNVPLSGNLLRVLDKGVLILSEGKTIRFISWNQVKAVVNKNAYAPFRGVLCEWFKLCPQAGGTSNE